jgi:hypothetical protein
MGIAWGAFSIISEISVSLVISNIATSCAFRTFLSDGKIIQKRRKRLGRPPASQLFSFDYCQSGSVLLLPDLREALAAVDGTVRLGLERNLRLGAAPRANGGEVLPGTASRVLAGITAGLAALRLILETTLSIKLLLSGGKHELLSAFLTH